MSKLIYLYLILAIFVAACTPQQQTTTVTTTERVPVNSNTSDNANTSEVPDSGDEVPPIKEDQADTDDRQPSYEDKEVVTTIPSTKEHNVPFTSQAPFGNWDPPYDEACEEASMLMVARFIENKGITSDQADQVITDLAKWESDNGYTIDITAEETVDVFKQYFGYNSKVSTDTSIARIKKELAQDNLIIIPAAGRMLGNPYFSGAGPVYHMLVITGYTDTTFITNDPGTRRGDGYEYDQNVIINAIHDWDASILDPQTGQPSDSKMRQTQKAMVIIPINQ